MLTIEILFLVMILNNHPYSSVGELVVPNNSDLLYRVKHGGFYRWVMSLLPVEVEHYKRLETSIPQQI